MNKLLSTSNFKDTLENLGHNFFLYQHKGEHDGVTDCVLYCDKHQTYFAYKFAYSMDFVKVYVPFVDTKSQSSLSMLFPFQDVWLTPGDIVVTDTKQRTLTFKRLKAQS